MIVEAINKRTGKTVKIEKAYSGQRLTCPYCGVDVHPVLGVETPFYRCYEGGKHTHCICKQLDRSSRVYDPQLTDISQLFDKHFHSVISGHPPFLCHRRQCCRLHRDHIRSYCTVLTDTPQSLAISPVVYFDIAFTSLRSLLYSITQRNKQYLTQGDFL